mgnify:FL=1|jgi:hypothetical protein
MADTMINMEFKKVDVLNVDQLEVDDYISVNGDIVQITGITPLSDGYAIMYLDDYDETDLIEVDDYATFSWYIPVDEDIDE